MSLMSSKDYVADLKRGSPSNQATNDEFKYIASNYYLYSFYETRAMLGGVIVDKDSACIGACLVYGRRLVAGQTG